MSQDVTITLRVDDGEVKAKTEQWERRILHLNNEINEHSRNWGRVFRGALSAVGMTTSLIRRFVSMTGRAMNPVFGAILNAVTQTVYSLQAIAAAWTAGGITAAFAIPVEAAAITLAITGIGLAMTGQQDLNNRMLQMQSTIDSLAATMGSYGRLYQSWGG